MLLGILLKSTDSIRSENALILAGGLRGDQVGDLGDPVELIPVHFGLQDTIGIGHALVLAKMLEP